MAEEAARKERTLPNGSSFPPEAEAPMDPPVVLDLPPDERNERTDDHEPSLTKIEGPSNGDDAPSSGSKLDGATVHDTTNRRSGVLRTVVKVLVWTTLFPVLCVLPIVLALHTSINAYQGNGHDAWVALSIGVLAAMLTICTGVVAFMLSFRIRKRFFMPFVNLWLLAILCYSGYALFHLSNANAKTTEIRDYYTSLHPLLRVAVKNLSMADDQLLITDLHRTPDDYQVMGLPLRERSMHFKQPTGFVHAVDIRTNGRSKVKNLLVELYFVVMGFETIRHIGTADHLHVSLPLRQPDGVSASSGDGPD